MTGIDNDATLDFQSHTDRSDGSWPPETLLDAAHRQGLAVVSVTDHDRVDHVADVQRTATEIGVHCVSGVEMSTRWRNARVDVLCYGFDPQDNRLAALCDDLLERQSANTRATIAHLADGGFINGGDESVAAIATRAASVQPRALYARLCRSMPAWRAATALQGAGCEDMVHELPDVVEAAHRSGAVALISHPGRGGSYAAFTPRLIEELREDTGIDGLEVWSTHHTARQVADFSECAGSTRMLASAGSDAHGPSPGLRAYPVRDCRALLERLGIEVR